MCTVTVYRPALATAKHTLSADLPQLVVTMNRDERRDRQAEVPPQRYDHQQSLRLYPLDSDANGTWFGVNQLGICLSLLNRYDSIDYTASKSRGLIIPDLLLLDSVQTIKAALLDMALGQFSPFTLFINTAYDSAVAQWDGRNLAINKPMVGAYMHISSSSWQSDDVLPWRKSLFETWVEQGAEHNAQGMPSYNLMQPEGWAKYAPRVSRENAYTKSITQYAIYAKQVQAKYWSEQVLPNGTSQDATMHLSSL